MLEEARRGDGADIVAGERLVTWRIETGDVLDVLRRMPDCSFDALLSDPPYGLGTRQPTVEEIVAYLTGAELDVGGDFMSKEWLLPSVAMWREVYRVLKPGAPVLAFGGTRMYDLLTLGMRAAGFEVRDSLMWLYGVGFPKSLDVSKALDKAAGAEREVVGMKRGKGGENLNLLQRPTGADDPCAHGCGAFGVGAAQVDIDIPITAPASDLGKLYDGMGTALKPAWEPIVLARKPLDGTMAENITRWGVGPIAIDACRIGFASDGDEREAKAKNDHEAFESGARGQATAFSAHTAPRASYAAPGRWPANLILSHADGCVPMGTKLVNGSAPGGLSPGHRGNGFEHATGRGPSPHFYADVDGKETVEAYDCVPDCPVRLLDEQSGDLASRGNVRPTTGGGGMYGHATIDYAWAGPRDAGGASRFFFCAKVSTFEREFGCKGLPLRDTTETVQREPGSKGTQSPRAGGQRNAGAPLFHCSECGANISSSGGIAGSPCIDGGGHTPIQVGVGPKVRNHHVSLKPIALIKYLATLIKPPMGGRLLVPYSGAGSEMIGAMRAGWTDIVGLERDAEYVAIAEARLKRWAEVPAHVDPLVTKPEPKLAAQGASSDARSRPPHPQASHRGHRAGRGASRAERTPRRHGVAQPAWVRRGAPRLLRALPWCRRPRGRDDRQRLPACGPLLTATGGGHLRRAARIHVAGPSSRTR